MNLLMINVHSAKNLGDEAIMQVTLDGLQKKFPQAKITVAANDPQSWEKHSGFTTIGSLMHWIICQTDTQYKYVKWKVPLYGGLLILAMLSERVLHKEFYFGNSQQRELLKAYYSADLILSCGGGNFYSNKSLSVPFIWSLLMVELGTRIGKTVVMLPQSFGPIPGSFQKFLLKRCLQKVKYILVRDEPSYALLKQLKIERVILLPDLAFNLTTPEPSPREESPQPRLKIGVTLIDRAAQIKGYQTIQENYIHALITVLKRLNQEKNADISIFVQCYGPSRDQDDRIISQKLFEHLSSSVPNIGYFDQFQDAKELKKAYSQMDCMIVTRMHAGILALNSKVPVLMIGYQPKAIGPMKLLGLEKYYIPIEQVHSATLWDLTAELISNKAEIRASLYRQEETLTRNAQAWLSYLP